MKFYALVIACSLALAPFAHGDMPAAPHQYVSVSPRLGWFYFTMIPEQHPELSSRDRFLNPDGFGIAYELQRDGSSKELWRTSGWYSFEVYLSLDGEDLVAMGPWNELPGPKTADVALKIFHRGVLVKQYTVLELVRDRTKLKRSVSHYSWQGEAPYASFDTMDSFSVKTCDGLKYDFDPKTGAIKYVHSP